MTLLICKWDLNSENRCDAHNEWNETFNLEEQVRKLLDAPTVPGAYIERCKEREEHWNQVGQGSKDAAFVKHAWELLHRAH